MNKQRVLNAYSIGKINITTLLELAKEEGLTAIVKPNGKVELIKDD